MTIKDGDKLKMPYDGANSNLCCLGGSIQHEGVQHSCNNVCPHTNVQQVQSKMICHFGPLLVTLFNDITYHIQTIRLFQLQHSNMFTSTGSNLAKINTHVKWLTSVGGSDGVVVKTLASHHCKLGPISRIATLLVSLVANSLSTSQVFSGYSDFLLHLKLDFFPYPCPVLSGSPCCVVIAVICIPQQCLEILLLDINHMLQISAFI